ncbi:MAG: hypothetical protein JWQ63_436 [Mucilaginibacter sp.]|nr:hypothetical protein [Mucilaginibacter sp.]
MHYAIITYGSRCDVQPYIALALGLMARGHEVTLLAPENFKNFVEGYGVTFYPLHGNLEELIYSPEVLSMLKSGNMVSLLRYMQRAGRKIQSQVNQGMIAGCLNADIMIASVLSIIWVHSIAEKLNKKWGILQLSLPSTPTKEFPFSGLAFFNFPAYNIFTHRLVRFLYWQFNKKDLNRFRKSLGLTIARKSLLDLISKENILNLWCISPQLVANPKDWNSNSGITGFLTLPAKKRVIHPMDQIPPGLKEWLQNGEKPVYIGFGSIPIPDTDLFCKILNEIIIQTQFRIILCKGWSDIPGLITHPDLFVVKFINHEWLFPQCKTAVIHGGAGTTAAVIKAKISAIVVSVFADQPWWGKIIEDKNLGIHIPFKKLTAQKLLKAIEISQTPEMRKSVSETGEKINNEDGLKIALDAIENYFD